MLRQRSINRDKYEPIPSEQAQEDRRTSDDFDPSQFHKPELKFPTKSALLIFSLFFMGVICLVSAIVNFDNDPWPFLILAIITLLPGAFYGWICIAVLLKLKGYSIEDIP